MKVQSWLRKRQAQAETSKAESRLRAALSKKDKIPGGLADKKKPQDFDQESLKQGIKVEMEHTSDPSIAREIAMDHLTEDSQYYKKLKTIEKSSLLSAFFSQTERDHGRDARAYLAKELMSEVKGIATPYVSEKQDPEHTALRYERYVKDPAFREEIKNKAPSAWHKNLIDTEAKAAYRKMTKKLTNISKNELSKSVDEKDWSRIGKAHNADANLLVDHSAHMEKYPAPKKYAKMLADPKKVKGLGKRQTNGISAKMVHSISNSGVPGDEEKYMAKPYHKKIESATKGWVKKPIMGWATMATKALYEAGKIGHLAEDVSVHEHEGTPLTVHKFAKDHSDLTNHRFTDGVKNTDPLHVQQIGVMDYLSNNVDRHYGNLMISPHTNTDGYNPLLAIDHERSFQYAKSLQESKPYRQLDLKQDTPFSYIENSALKPAHGNFHSYAELQDWWTNHKDNIQSEFSNQVKHIKDEGFRKHVSTNFHNRWNAMNDWAANLDDQFNKKSLHEDFRKVRNVPYQEARLTSKSIRSHLSKNPSEAMRTLAEIVNKKDNVTSTQWHALKNTMAEIVSKMSPHEMSSFYLNAMKNPNYNTQKIRQHNELNPKQVILNHLSNNNWEHGNEGRSPAHLKAMIDAIDSLPHEDKQQLNYWRDHFSRILSEPQENIA